MSQQYSKRCGCLVRWLVVCAAGLLPPVLHAQEILIGQILPLSGPLAAVGKELNEGAMAYIDDINRRGGVNGARIKVTTLDDGFQVDKAVALAKELTAAKPLALFQCFGSGACPALMPVINEAQVPLIAPVAGADVLRTPVNKFVFNVRPSTAEELTRLTEQLITVGASSIGVVYQDDGFGKSSLKIAEGVLAAQKVKAAATVAIDPKAPDYPGVVRRLAAANANGLLLLLSTGHAANIVKEGKKGGLETAQYMNLAAQANPGFLKIAGGAAKGVTFVTFTPSPWRASTPVVKEYQALYAQLTGKKDFSYLSLEGFINAKVLVEGIRRAGPKPTPAKLTAAMEALANYDLGGFVVSFSPQNHSGSRLVDMAIVSADGAFVQ